MGVGELARCVAGRCERTCAAGFVARDGACVHGSSPLPVAPRSTAALRTNRPVLRWTLPPDAEGAVVELCRQRDCAPVTYRLTAAGTSIATPGLSPGPWFWRLRSLERGVPSEATSATWVLRVLPHARASASSWPLNDPGSDIDANGRQEFGVAAEARPIWRVVPFAHLPYGARAMTPPGFGGDRVGDLDGDGFPDLLTHAPDLGFGWNRWSGDRWGGFVHLPTVLPDRADSHNSVVADFSDDGMDDFLMLSRGRLHLYLGGPAGLAAGPAAIVLLPEAPEGLSNWRLSVVGDVNEDGRADIAIAASGPYVPDHPTYYARIGLGPVGSAMHWSPVFQVRSSIFQPGPDTDGDGRREIISTVEGDDRSFDLLRVEPEGLVPIARVTIPADSDVEEIDALDENQSDFDGDGYDDVVVLFSRRPGGRIQGDFPGVYFFRGSPTGPRSPPAARLDLFGTPFGTADVNDDGITDLVAYLGASQAVYLGSPRGLSSSPDVWFVVDPR